MSSSGRASKKQPNATNFASFIVAQVPTEDYRVEGRRVVHVYRADMSTKAPLPPYIKMVELLPFLRMLADDHYGVAGYYATPDSDWTPAFVNMAKSMGIVPIVGLSKLKDEPPLQARLGDAVYLIKPNMYSVNFSITKKEVQRAAIEHATHGFMIPMGLDHPLMVANLCAYLDACPLPKCDWYIVPTGSGVALSGVLSHLRGRAHVFGVCTRPQESVLRVVRSHVEDVSNLTLYDAPERDPACVCPWPAHRNWEDRSYRWMVEEIRLHGMPRGSLCYVNLGS